MYFDEMDVYFNVYFYVYEDSGMQKTCYLPIESS